MKNNLTVKIFFVLFTIFLTSCDLLRDKPFEVISWLPGAGFCNSENDIAIYVEFSKEPDRTSVEKAFSFTANGAAVNGIFNWQDNTLKYSIYGHLEKNIDYVISIKTEAQDKNGDSLANTFEGSFTTRNSENRIQVLSCEPEDESIITNTWQKIKLTFNDSVSISSCYNDISFSPSISGMWQAEDDNKTVTFYPKEQWKETEIYKFTISSSLQSINGKELGETITKRFIIGNDKEAPVLENAYAVDETGTIIFELLPYLYNEGSTISENLFWESDYKLKLLFSKPVDVNRLNSLLIIEPSLKYSIDHENDFYSDVIIAFTGEPVWDNRYNIKINSGIRDAHGNESTNVINYKIRTNGTNSFPPELAGIRLPDNFLQEQGGVRKTDFTSDDLYEYIIIDNVNFPIDVRKNIIIELYFKVADGCEIDLFSVRELFRLDTTNNSLIFSPKVVSNQSFYIPEPAGMFSDYKRVEIKGDIENKTNSGIIKFYIASGLRDSKNHKNLNFQAIELTK
ncbi:hypothetical protein FACS1894190_01530 [Spirochaetia bacterium]|nr:hypothetical protein FACS1894190_01530 [Spirochaetia bacterium]